MLLPGHEQREARAGAAPCSREAAETLDGARSGKMTWG